MKLIAYTRPTDGGLSLVTPAPAGRLPDEPEGDFGYLLGALSPAAAVAASEALRLAATTALVTSNEYRDVAMRALIRDLYTRINDLRQKLGLERELEPTIIGRVVSAVGAGLGEV